MTALAPSPTADLAACFARVVTLIEDVRLKFQESVKTELDRRRTGLDFVQAMILYRVGEKEVTAGELQRYCYGKKNVTYNLKLLKARGHLAVQTRDDDGRKRHIRRTDKGREIGNLVATLLAKYADALPIMGDVTVDDLATTERTLRRVSGFLTHQIAYRLC